MTKREKAETNTLVERGGTAKHKTINALVEAGMPSTLAAVVARSEDSAARFLIQPQEIEPKKEYSRIQDCIVSHLLQNPDDAPSMISALDQEQKAAEDRKEFCDQTIGFIETNYGAKIVQTLGRSALI